MNPIYHIQEITYQGLYTSIRLYHPESGTSVLVSIYGEGGLEFKITDRVVLTGNPDEPLRKY